MSYVITIVSIFSLIVGSLLGGFFFLVGLGDLYYWKENTMKANIMIILLLLIIVVFVVSLWRIVFNL